MTTPHWLGNWKSISALWVATIALTWFIASARKPDGTPSPAAPAKPGVEAIQPGPAPAPDTAGAQPSHTSASTTPLPPNRSGAHPDHTATAPVPPLSGAEVREYLAGSLQSNDLISRQNILGHMLSRLSPDNVDEFLRIFETTPHSFHTDNDFGLFLHAWAKMDGPAALDYIFNKPGANQVAFGTIWAMSGWAQADPQAAFEYVQAQERVDHDLYYGLIRGWARVNLAEANTYVETLEDRGLRRRMVDVLAESYQEQYGAAGALRWAAQTAEAASDPGFARAVLEDVIKRAGTQNPAAVAKWIGDQPDHPDLKPWMLEHTAGNLANRDPELAAAWVQSQFGNEQLNSKVVERVIGPWASQDPASAAEWVDTIEDPDLLNDGTAYNLAGSWAAQDPDAAFAWVADKLDSKLQRAAYGGAVGRMPEEHLASTGDWLRSTPADTAIDGARTAYAWRVFEEQPKEALAQVSRIADPDSLEQFLVPLGQKMYLNDPAALRAWLPTSGLSPSAQQKVLRAGEHNK